MWLNAIIDDANVCSAFAAAVLGEKCGRAVWEGATKLQPDARLVSGELNTHGAQLCTELLAGGSCPTWESLGFSAEAMAEVKEHVKAEMGEQSVYQNRWEQFVAEHGYVTP